MGNHLTPTGHRRDWKSEIIDLEKERDEARELARIMYEILLTIVDPGDLHDKLRRVVVPDWIW